MGNAKKSKPNHKGNPSAKRISEYWYFLRNTSSYLGYLLLFLLGLGSGASLLAYFSAGELYDYQDSIHLEHLPEVDVIVCLGGGRGRISVASEIWNRYWELNQHKGPLRDPLPKIPVLYFSGMGRSANWNLLSRQIRRDVIQRIQPENVFIEKDSSNTDENARFLVRNAQLHHWGRMILLTSSYHMKRAHFIFDQVLESFKDPLTIETYSVFQEPFTPNEWRKDPNGVRVTLLEYLKWIYYRTAWKPSPQVVSF